MEDSRRDNDNRDCAGLLGLDREAAVCNALGNDRAVNDLDRACVGLDSGLVCGGDHGGGKSAVPARVAEDKLSLLVGNKLYDRGDEVDSGNGSVNRVNRINTLGRDNFAKADERNALRKSGRTGNQLESCALAGGDNYTGFHFIHNFHLT